MRKMSKRSSAVIAAAVTVGAVAAGTIAYAAFERTQAAGAGNQGAEQFAPLTVTATWIGVRPGHSGDPIATKLLPGDKADVKVALVNPNYNTVNGKVVSIKPVGLTDDKITGIASDADRNYCRSKLSLRDFAPSNLIIGKGGDSHTVDLWDAVSLDESADIRCSNMTFPLNYQVTFAATRAAVSKPGAIAPAAPPAAPKAGVAEEAPAAADAS